MPAFAGMTVIGSNEYLADPFGDHRGFVFALDLDGKFGGLLPLAGALFIEREQREAAAHALARADGLEEAHPVAAVIDAPLRARDPGRGGHLLGAPRHQRKREAAVRDRSAERSQLPAFWVHVDEL